jgi:glycosyltransferase involved in cell wall biosynthesis
MNNDELISVVMPVHNAGDHLCQAVQSIMLQSYRNFELIIVDDHSTDKAIEKLQCNDARIKKVSSPRRGVVHAMRYGASQALGSYIARMDADDQALPKRLEVQLEFLKQNPDIGIVAAQVEIFSDKELGEGFQVYQDWLNSVCTPEQIRCEMYVESPLPNPSVMFRREVYEQLGGYHDSEWAEDYDCWLRASAMNIKMAKPKGILLRGRDHGHRLTRTDERYSLDNFMRAKVHYLATSMLDGKNVVIWGTGPTGVQLHDMLREQNINITGFIDIHPRRIGGVKRELPVWPMDKVDELDNEIILGAVGSRGARDEIREFLSNKGKQEGKGFLFVS